MSLVPTRNSGPLGQLQHDADKLKTKVNEVSAISQKWTSKSAQDLQVQNCHKDCVRYLSETSNLLKEAEELELHNEPKLPGNFEEKKKDEINRLKNFQERLIRLMKSMEELPDGDELKLESKDDSVEKIKKVTIIENPKEMNGVVNDESDDEYADLYIAVDDFTAEQEGDLSIKKHEILDVLSKRDDGWWHAENDAGERGMVPSNYLRECSEDDETAPEDGAHVEPSSREPSPSNVQNESVEIRRGPQETPPPTPPEVSPHQSLSDQSTGKRLWGEMRKSLETSSKIDVTDVLAAMGALPAGFRPSFLHHLETKSDKYSLKHTILPARTKSNLTYRDLVWDSSTGGVRHRLTRILRTCNLWKCNQIPLPGTGVEVLSHHVRFALFDGANVVSNIVTVRALVQPNRPKQWQFSSPKLKDGGIIPTLMHGNTVIRSNNLHTNISILFELGITYIRTPPKRVVQYSDGAACEYGDSDDDEEARALIRQTGEKGELSCGWCRLKLFDELGNRIVNRTYELPLQGGTPFEVGVDVDPSIQRKARGSRLRSLLAATKQPKLFVQIGEPGAAERNHIYFLPANIFFPASYTTLLWMFRRVLVDALLCDRTNPQDCSIVHSPVISTFLKAIDQPDVMDAIKRNWGEKERFLNKGEKKDESFLVSMFKSVVMETAFPLFSLKTLPNPSWADFQIEEARRRYIAQKCLDLKQEKGVLSHFLTANQDMRPFDISEVTFDPVSRSSLNGVMS